MSSTAAIASKVASADPVAQAKLHVQLKVLEQQRAIQAKQAEEMRKKVEAEERDRKMGKISGFARVKAVNSGDSIVLVGQPLSPGSMPPEKLMTLSGIEAPKIGRGKKADEPFAYASREFLRKLLIGQLVGFSVTQVNEATGRSYGIVTLSDEDVAHLVVASGWAKVKDVKTRNNEIPPERQALLDLESKAKEDKLGIWQTDVPKDQQIRNVINIDKGVREFYEKLKNTPIPAVVEQVRDGSTVRVEFCHENKWYSLVVHISGIQCPRSPPPFSVLQEKYIRDKETNPDLKPPVEEKPQAFGQEAKCFTEIRLLQRDVQLTLFSFDKANNVFGSIVVPQGNIAISLLRNGFAKYIDWSAVPTGDSAALKSALIEARSKKLNIWAGDSSSAILAEDKNEFTAKVIQILSGDQLVLSDVNGTEIRVSLSSIRAPRAPGRSQRAEPYGSEAKEFLRKRLIGKKVTVLVEYSKLVSKDAHDKRLFVAILGSNKQNISVKMVGAGLASVISHRMEDERSKFYEDLLEAEAAAQKARVGMYSKEPYTASSAPLDLSEKVRVPKSDDPEQVAELDRKQKEISFNSKKFLPFLLNKKVSGIVDYVISGSRCKVFIPKENILIPFVLSGIKCPKEKESFGQEALKFTKDAVLQHDVFVEVETMDRAGNFVGIMKLQRRNLSIELLLSGLATVFPPSADKSPYCTELYKAEEEAKKNRIAIWTDYDEEKERRLLEEKQAELLKAQEQNDEPSVKQFKLKVIEVIDPTSFWFQNLDIMDLEEIESKLSASSSVPVSSPQNGGLYMGLFTDGKWYRCRVEYPDEAGYVVTFVDYGNQEVLPLSSLRSLDASLAKIPPIAQCGVLSCVKHQNDYFEEAFERFGQLVWDKELSAVVDFSERGRGKLHLSIKDDAEEGLTVNQVLLREGLLRVLSRPERKLMSKAKELKSDQEFAMRKHYGMWEYGEVSSDEE